MPKITYIGSSGKRKTIEVQKGLSVMEGQSKTIFPELMQIAVAEWHVQPAMFMSKKNGLIN